MGLCPCPRCAIKKENFYALGTTSDAANRISKVWRDDDNFRSLVEEARDNIYRRGYALHSERGVESLLKEESLVPTLVSYSVLSAGVLDAHIIFRAHFRTPSKTSNLIYSSLLSSTSCMSSNLGYGRPFSSILSGYSILLVQSKSRNLTLGVYTFLKSHRTRLIIYLSFRQIAPFGSTTIRWFTHNVADLKKLAAWDFEDILQVCPSLRMLRMFTYSTPIYIPSSVLHSLCWRVSTRTAQW